MDIEVIRIFAAKAAALAVLPLSVALLLLAVAIVANGRRSRAGGRRAAFAALGVLGVCSMPPTGNSLMGGLESRYPPLAIDGVPTSQVAIVLGGGIRDFAPPRTMIELGSAANRLLYAARLYRAGKVGYVIASGGSLTQPGSGIHEAELMRRLLVEWGVPSEHVVVEDQSRTTWENATNVAVLWREKGIRSGLLITSANHMPRALAAFRRNNLDVVPASTDLYSGSMSSVLDIIPSAEALALCTMAMREWIGLIGYRLIGRG